MLLFALIALVAPVCGTVASPVLLNKRGISTALYDDLVYYFKYASSSYGSNCAHPNRNTLIKEVHYFASRNYGCWFVESPCSSRTLTQAPKGSSHATTRARRSSSHFAGGVKSMLICQPSYEELIPNSTSALDFVTDFQVKLEPFNSPGTSPPGTLFIQ